MDGALTVPPRVQAVPPVRNTSASSMQSPPASAEATSVSSLVARVRPPRGIAQVEALPGRVRAGRDAGPGWREGAARHWPPGGGRRRRYGCGRGGCSGSIYWVLLFRGRFFCCKTIIPEAQEHLPLPLQDANATPSFGGFRLRERSDDPVLVVKGEKTSDAVRALIPSYSPITSMGEGAAPERLEAPDGRRYGRRGCGSGPQGGRIKGPYCAAG